MEDYLWDLAENDEARVQELIDGAGVTRPIALVLNARGIAPEQIQDFLNPSLSNIGDPYLLPGTRDASARLWQAIQKNQRILIHGDYDTDGITASALVAWVLRRNGAQVECYLPHRIDDGYGLTAESIAKTNVDNFDLLLTVDCGITSYEAVALALEKNLDLIITDHHTPGAEPIVATAVVDPKLPGSPLEIQELAGVGVAFKVCQAFLKYGREMSFGGEDTDLRQVLDLVALGTVADIVPLLHENRILVKHGLEILARQHRPGIHALCDIAGVSEELATTDITYRLAPRINATGRMGDPTDSLRLLEADNVVDAATLARRLDAQNRERQTIEEAVVQDAEAQIARRYDLGTIRSLVVWSDNWHQGVVGIVASRLTRRYHRPSVVLTRDPSGQFTGSARSIRRLNLVELLGECSGSLIRFGGHAMAAGLSLYEENLPVFCQQFDEAVQRVLSIDSMQPSLSVCGEVNLDELDDVFFQELRMLEPFGHGNPEPVFLTRGIIPERRLPAGRSHTRGMVRDNSGTRLPFIAFGRLPQEFPPPPWDVVFSPHINRFNGSAIPQMRIHDVRTSILNEL
ncbi:single-stranded-DNA-specific exonuclease RecJ [Oligosphaera ethanolica]|uniref:Single-stranded-DNA-specific exonuclease RecJ n=1 Tax=Oligosphaera ethanolica TaxID=760260 RepID=A0AAE3VI91_9BACT|nr:single-stranded-DNA-specific exonuclease RecJ [Oligosphaera ethanolica]MDQ0290629.1 single-stranded-DNA-specific exonuclease [Oligosphaera ethanolica]NLE56305.1 single-stranded-DNA-specific exonuclease RecJ [Lentisphaerota bacterium]